jgi:hypothetical protein
VAVVEDASEEDLKELMDSGLLPDVSVLCECASQAWNHMHGLLQFLQTGSDFLFRPIA